MTDIKPMKHTCANTFGKGDDFTPDKECDGCLLNMLWISIHLQAIPSEQKKAKNLYLKRDLDGLKTLYILLIGDLSESLLPKRREGK